MCSVLNRPGANSDGGNGTKETGPYGPGLDSLLCKENCLADFPLGPTRNTVISITLFIHRTATARAEGRGDGMTRGIERETMGVSEA